MGKNKSTGETVLIGVGLEADNQANSLFKSTMTSMVADLSKVFTDFGKNSTVPLTQVMKQLTSSVDELNARIASVKLDPLTKGVAEASTKVTVLAKDFNDSTKSIGNAIDATTKKMAGFFGIDEASEKFKKLGAVVNEAMQFNGVESGMKKISTMRDMVLQVGKEVAKVNSKEAVALASKANDDLSNVKMFSLDKYKAEIDRAKKDYQQLIDKAAKGGVSGSNITDFQREFGYQNLFSNKNNTTPTNTLEHVQDLRNRIADAGKAVENTINFNKIDAQAEKLKSTFRDLVPDTLKNKIDGLFTTKWDDSISGTRKFGEALRKVKEEVDALNLATKARGEKLYADSGVLKAPGTSASSYAVPTGAVTNISSAYSQALAMDNLINKNGTAQQQALGAAINAANNHTDAMAQKSRSFQSNVIGISRDIDTLQKRADDYNRIAASTGNKTIAYNSGGISATSIVDVKTMSDAKVAVGDLRKQLADLMREANTDRRLDKQIAAVTEEARKADVTLERLKIRSDSLNASFANVAFKTTTNTDANKLQDVKSLQGTLSGQLASSTGTKAELDAIAITIDRLTLAMKNFKETGSRIKDSTGSPFDNLLRGVPTQLVTLDLMKQKIADALVKAKTTMQDLDSSSLGKINKQLKDMGYQINSTTKEFEKLSTIKKPGIFSWLPESMSGMAGRLAEFYSLRTILFTVANQFREGTKAAIDHNQAVHDILAISGEAKSAYGDVSASIYEIAKSSRFTAAEVGGLMQVLAQAGVKAKDLSQVSIEVGKFATAASADPKLAADLATTAMNTFKIGAGETARVTNAMTAALNLSKLEASGLATAFNYLAPQAAQLGMSMEQTLGIIANMAQSGVKASTIGTGVSQMLKEFSAPKPRLQSMLKEYGLTADDINPMKKEFADIVQTLQDKGVTVDKLFSAMETRVGRTVVTAINLSSQSFRDMTASLTGTQAALVAYDKTMDGAKARLNVVKQSFQELATMLGEYLAPALIRVTGAIGDVVRVLADDHGSWAKLIMQIGLATVGIGLLLKTSTALMAVNWAGKMGAASSAILGIGTAAKSAIVWMIGLSAGAVTCADVVAAAFAVMRTALITSGIGIAIALAAWGVSALIDKLGEKRRAEEEAVQTSLKTIDAHERTANALNSVAHGSKESSAAIAKYYALIKEGKTHEEALNIVGKTRVNVTNDQKEAIRKLIAENGPHTEYLKRLLEEGDTLKGVIELTRILNDTRNNTSKTARTTYNSGVITAEDTALKAFDYQVSMGRVPGNKEAIEQKRNAIKKAATDKFAKEHQDLVNLGTAPTMENGEVTEESYMENGRLISHGVAPIIKPKTGGPSTRPDKTIPASNVASNLQKIFEMRISEEKASLDKDKPLPDEYEARRTGRTLKDSEIEALYDKMVLAKNDKILDTSELSYADLEAMKAHAMSAKAQDKLKKLGSNPVKESDKVIAKYLENASLGKDKEIADKEVKDNRDKRVKEETDYLANVEKQMDEATKKLSEAKRKNLDKEIGDGNTSEERRQAAFEEFMASETDRIRAEESIKFSSVNKAYEEKQAAGIPTTLAEDRAYGKSIDIGANDIVNRVDESKVGALDKKKTGTLANLDIRIKTEQELLAVSIRQQKVIQDEQWGYDNIRDVMVQTLEIEGQSLEKHYALLNLKKLEDLSTEEKAKVNADLLVLDERRKKLASDILDLKRSEVEAMREGAREALADLTNTDKLSKQFGANVTNTAFNGIADSLAGAMNVVTNPDTSKIADLNKQIGDLNRQKLLLTGEISAIEGNSNKTPEELRQLQEKKVALAGVNTELDRQNKALNQQKSGWESFAESMKKTMQTVLQELQKYISQLFVTYAVQKLVGVVTSMMGGTGASTTGDMNFMGPVGSREGMATGGMVPLNMGVAGKDSVPAMLMPGEVVIKKSSVDYYGANKLLAMNDKRIQKFAEGGLVGGGSGKNGEKQEFALHIVNIADASQIPQKPANAQEIINIVSYDLARKGPLHKSVRASLGG